MVESHNPASLNVSWQPPLDINHNGPITGYVIQYTRVRSSDMMSVNVTSGTTHTISGLVAYVNYSVIVAAKTVNGTGPFSDPPVVGRPVDEGKLNLTEHTYVWHELNMTRFSFYICASMHVHNSLQIHMCMSGMHMPNLNCIHFGVHANCQPWTVI